MLLLAWEYLLLLVCMVKFYNIFESVRFSPSELQLIYRISTIWGRQRLNYQNFISFILCPYGFILQKVFAGQGHHRGRHPG